MGEKFRRFMIGRYGADQFSQFLIHLAVVCVVLSLFLRSSVWNVVIFALIIFAYYRVFSKNHQKRYAENQKFLQVKGRFTSWFQKKKYLLGQRKDFRIYTCPGCGQKIRIPKGKGKIMVRCPKCSVEFEKKS